MIVNNAMKQDAGQFTPTVSIINQEYISISTLYNITS